MKRKDVRAAYYEYSGKTSDVSRTLALSAIAIIWVLKVEGANGPSLPSLLLVAGLFAVGALTADLLHYVIATVLWGSFHRAQEKKEGVTEDTDFDAPRKMNWPGITLFSAKVVMTVVAYILLLSHIALLLNLA